MLSRVYFFSMRYFIFFIFGLIISLSFGVDGREPQGTSALNGKIYMDECEVTNGSWLEYMESRKSEADFDTSHLKFLYPKMDIWKKAYPTDFDNLGFYKNYPVVAISFPQVLDYCRWRSKTISQKRKTKIVYELPNFEHYFLASNQNSDSPAADLYSTKFDHRRNFIGVCDNAAEMTNIEGLAINGFFGEGCLDSLRFRNYDSRLGFRCIAYFKK